MQINLAHLFNYAFCFLLCIPGLLSLHSSSPNGDEKIRNINEGMTCSEIEGTGYLLVQVISLNTDRGNTGANPRKVAEVSCNGKELTLDTTKYQALGLNNTTLIEGNTYRVTVRTEGYTTELIDAKEAVAPTLENTRPKAILLYDLGLVNPRKNINQPKPKYILLDGEYLLIPDNFPEEMPRNTYLQIYVSTSGTPAVVSFDTDERGLPLFVPHSRN